ncbi:hypothetical protein HMPREF1508_1477 [Shuttleworthella sp. MSX8B]|nr:hypothetical protein HMPREF1508_1477 [Shuttleworthia sp. MSX8B]
MLVDQQVPGKVLLTQEKKSAVSLANPVGTVGIAGDQQGNSLLFAEFN